VRSRSCKGIFPLNLHGPGLCYGLSYTVHHSAKRDDISPLFLHSEAGTVAKISKDLYSHTNKETVPACKTYRGLLV